MELTTLPLGTRLVVKGFERTGACLGEALRERSGDGRGGGETAERLWLPATVGVVATVAVGPETCIDPSAIDTTKRSKTTVLAQPGRRPWLRRPSTTGSRD